MRLSKVSKAYCPSQLECTMQCGSGISRRTISSNDNASCSFLVSSIATVDYYSNVFFSENLILSIPFCFTTTNITIEIFRVALKFWLSPVQTLAELHADVDSSALAVWASLRATVVDPATIAVNHKDMTECLHMRHISLCWTFLCNTVGYMCFVSTHA